LATGARTFTSSIVGLGEPGLAQSVVQRNRRGCRPGRTAQVVAPGSTVSTHPVMRHNPSGCRSM
jgi:hypothetical protein